MKYQYGPLSILLAILLLLSVTLRIGSAFSPSSLKVPSSPLYRYHRQSAIIRNPTTTLLYESKQGEIDSSPPNLFSKFVSNLRTAASDGFGTRARNVGATMVEGDVVVPLCSNLDKRQSLAQRGLYAGVEYVICDIEDGSGEGEGEEIVSSNERSATLKPAYPLRPHLERNDWPISLQVSDVPLWLPRATYEAGTAIGTLMLAGTYLTIAAILASIFRIVVVPSESMEPALMPGDVVLVTRSIMKPKMNDVVFFNPPSELDEAIKNSKIGQIAKDEKVTIASTKGKQLLKRIAALPGDSVGVSNSNPYVTACNDDDCTYRIDRTGEYSRPDIFPDESWNRKATTLAEGEYFVAGDYGYRSVDSRVWGPLKEKYLFGTAQFVISPMKHFGPIQPGPFVVQDGL